MDAQSQRQIDELGRLTTKQLQKRFGELFGYEARSNHKKYLFRRIAWRLQALAEGDLSERAKKRALALANDVDLRIRAPKGFFKGCPEREATGRTTPSNDDRLPMPRNVAHSRVLRRNNRRQGA